MTDVQICNLALARLGDARITTLSDATAQAQYCSLFYAQTLEELQTEFDWQFCRKLASLTANATAPAFGYTRRFAVPTDFLRLIRLNGIDEDENFSKWEIVDGFIHTDLAEPAQIEYIANVTDSTKFPAVFVEILSAKLAANLALPLTGSKELFAQMAEVFSSNVQRPSVKALILATAKDRPSSTLTEDELCRQAILRVGTAEQFGPSSQAMLLAKSLYPQVRDSLLLTGSWTWAMKSTTVIETLPRPEYKWAYRYAIPSDCLRVFRVNDYDYSTGDSAWEVSGNFVLTNADSGSPAWVIDRSYEVGNAVSNNGVVYRCVVAASTKQPGVTSGWQTDWDIWLGSAIALEYVRKVTDVTLFDSLFIDLLTASLASKLAVPLTGDANKAALLAKETDILGKNPAMRRDSTERKGRIKPAWMSSKLVSSRNGGDGIDASQAAGGGPAGGVSYPSLLVTVGSVTNLPTGSTPTVTNTGTNDTAVLNFGLPQGPAGTVAVGTTSTSAEGTNASVASTGTPENRILSFTIPRGNTGNTGPQGPAATVAVGTVSTSNPGTNASVTNAGTSGSAVLNFSIPRGDVGASGPANSLSVGTISTGAAGSTAGATITGTAPIQTLNLTIPRGDVGAQGPQGIIGPAGPSNSISIGTVSTGTVGSSAAASITGTSPSQTLNLTIPVGATGAAGPQGPITNITSATAPTSPQEGTLWLNTNDLRTYIYYDSTWVEYMTGYNGTNNVLSIGTVTTAAAGSSAVATITGSSPNQTLNLTIPRGDIGQQGAQGNAGPAGPSGQAATISVGSVTTGTAGSSAAITNSGTTGAAVLNFTIPRGDKGATEYVGNIDGGTPATIFGGTNVIVGGTP